MTKLQEILSRMMYILSLVFPRSKNIWVFIGWHRGHNVEIFADNSKYLFLHVANNKKEIRPVWLAKDRSLATILREQGYTSYYEYSIKGIWHALRAGTTIIDAFLQPENYRFSGNTRLVQLLHGKGMKKGGYAQAPLRPQDYIFSPSQFVVEMLPSIFVQQSKIIIAGYPRNDVFAQNITGSEIGIHQPTKTILKSKVYKKYFLYAPTFRRGEKTFDLEKTLDLPSLSKWLLRNNYLLALNLHPKYRDQTRDISYPNIHVIEESDIYPLFPLFDVLITDYSSIFTDFLLLDRPIIFYPYDLENYKETEGISFDSYDTYTPGPKAYTPQELLDILRNMLEKDAYSDERTRVRNLYHTHQDGNSAERIVNTLS